jgi:hypothetical protein
MNLIRLLFAGRRFRLEELADQIAERAIAEVERRMSTVIHTMSQAEIRGYVRARASKPVRQQMQFVLSNVPALSPDQREEVLILATDRTVARVVGEIAGPRREVKVRRAA